MLTAIISFEADSDTSHSTRVKEVTPEHVVYTTKDKATGKTIEKRIPANFVLWSTGIAMNPFTRQVSDLLPNQVHKKVSIKYLFDIR